MMKPVNIIDICNKVIARAETNAPSSFDSIKAKLAAKGVEIDQEATEQGRGVNPNCVVVFVRGDRRFYIELSGENFGVFTYESPEDVQVTLWSAIIAHPPKL